MSYVTEAGTELPERHIYPEGEEEEEEEPGVTIGLEPSLTEIKTTAPQTIGSGEFIVRLVTCAKAYGELI